MGEHLRVLLIEDVQVDAELVLRELKRAGLRCASRRVQAEDELRLALVEFQPQVILSDFSMPHFDGMSALAVVREVAPEVPFIFVSGTLGEEYAIRALREGAADYVLKTNLVRLPPSVERAVREARERAARHKTERELETLRERIQSIVSTLPDVVWSIAVPSRELLYVSPSIATVFGHTSGTFFRDGRLSDRYVHPDDLARVTREWERAVAGGPFDCEFRTLHGDGGVRWVHARGSHATDATGTPVRLDGIARDVTERHEQQLTIAHLNRIHTVLSQINALIVRVASREELYREACRIAVEAGQMRDAWIGVLDPEGQRIEPVAWHGVDDGFFALIRDLLQVGGTATEEWGLVPSAIADNAALFANDIESDPRIPIRNTHLRRGVRSMAALPLAVSDKVVGVLVLHAAETGFFNDAEIGLLLDLAGDISFALDHIDKGEKLNYLAYYDPLTGLANRSLFLERMDLHLQGASRERRKLAVLILNVDRFKTINDSLGRRAGDVLLKQIAERCSRGFGESSLLARFGADHFAMVMLGLRGDEEIGRRIDSCLAECFGMPFRLGDQDLRVSAKVGVAVFPGDGEDAETLLRNAEAAVKEAKQSGERYLFYAHEMTTRVAESLALENKLRRALDAQEFVLHYQPKVDLATRRIVGAEALIRWQSPGNGLVPPAKFIPLLEETGLILEVGAWAMRRAIEDHRRLVARAADAPVISVNVSSIQLGRADFVDTVRGALERGGERAPLELEITESMIMQDIQGNIAKLKTIRDLGVSIAIDDFGTGYSSLGYLAKLPVQTVKIDRSFIITMLSDPDVMTVVSTIISLAHSMRLRVVAEGVDSDAQAETLRLLGCDEMQGFLFSRAVPLERLEEMLASGQ